MTTRRRQRLLRAAVASATGRGQSVVMRRVVLAVLWFVIGCDAAAPFSPPPPASRADPYAATTTRVVVEVDVQPGAEPFTGNTVYGDTWSLTVDNLRALLGDDKELVVPRRGGALAPGLARAAQGLRQGRGAHRRGAVRRAATPRAPRVVRGFSDHARVRPVFHAANVYQRLMLRGGRPRFHGLV
jgi:hypothetical protein